MGFKYCSEGHIMEPSWKCCPVCLAPLAGWLVALPENGGIHKYYTIHEGKSFIGCAVDCEIRILDADLSRQHAYLTAGDGSCTIVDLGNGDPVQVNNRDAVKTSLIDGDLIKLGSRLFKIKLL